jgi:hypothetical protein
MSNVLPINQFKQFLAKREEVIDSLVKAYIYCIENPYDDAYTTIRPRKANQIYAKYHPERSTFYVEIEYKNVLLLWFYESDQPDVIEIQFATQWTDNEIDESDDPYYIPAIIDGGEFFQDSLINDHRFLTCELHAAIYAFVMEVLEEAKIRAEKYLASYPGV